MLWTDEQRQRVAAGEITVTYRAWKRPQAAAGGVYRLDGAHDIRGVSVGEAGPASITAVDASAAGHASVEEAVAVVSRRLAASPDARLYRVELQLQPAAARPAPAVPRETVLLRLARMDAGGRPWTARVLAAIGDAPHTVSTRLAASVGMERTEFKVRVRRLKALGLTTSHEVGYELTVAGREALARAAAGEGTGA